MTWPTVAVVTTNTDAGTDSPATARSDLLDAIQKLNQMIAHVSAFAATVLDDADAVAARVTLGARMIDLQSKSTSYTLVLNDAGVIHPASDANARTFTIDGSLAYPVGTALTFINESSVASEITMTTDTMYLASLGTTGIRLLAQHGVATVVKTSAGRWIINGAALT